LLVFKNKEHHQDTKAPRKEKCFLLFWLSQADYRKMLLQFLVILVPWW